MFRIQVPSDNCNQILHVLKRRFCFQTLAYVRLFFKQPPSSSQIPPLERHSSTLAALGLSSDYHLRATEELQISQVSFKRQPSPWGFCGSYLTCPRLWGTQGRQGHPGRWLYVARWAGDVRAERGFAGEHTGATGPRSQGRLPAAAAVRSSMEDTRGHQGAQGRRRLLRLSQRQVTSGRNQAPK